MADLPSDGGGGGGFVGVAIGAIGSILGHDSNDNPPPIPPPNSGITYSELLAWLLAHGARVFDIDHQTSRPMTQADVTAALEANPAGIEGYPEPQAGSNTGLAQAINEHIDTLGNILKAAITSGIAGNNAAVLGAISASTQAITGAIQQGNAQQTSVLTGATGSILDKLGQTAKGILDTLGNVFGNSTDIIQQALQGNITLTEALERAALAAIQKTVDDQTTTIATAIKKVNDAAAGQITQATHANEAVSQAIIDALKQQGAVAATNAETIQTGLETAIDELAGTSNSALAQVSTATSNETLAIGELGDKLTQSNKDVTMEAVAQAFGPDSATVFTQVSKFLGINEPVPDDFFVRALISFGVPQEQAEAIEKQLDGTIINGTMSKIFVTLAVTVYGILNVVTGITSISLNPLLQRLAKTVPSSLPTTAELTDMVVRGIMDKPTAIEAAQLQGFDPNVAEAVLELGRTLPDVGIIQTWFLRNFVDRDLAKERLAQLGFSDPDSDALIEMAFFIPPVGDLITMAVREVFSPDIAQKFGQFEDFPKDFAKYAAQQGVSEFWAQGYWAAHWALPSAEEGFAMFQRRIINLDDLQTLLRALDVMPYWRNKLVQLQYQPITRIDIRRMHDLGLLTDAEVKLRYQDIGYSPDDAELMTKFTIAYNSDTQTADPAGLEKLSRDVITSMYVRGIFSEGEALDLLESQGIGGLAAQIILQDASLQKELTDRDAQTNLILDQAKAGLLTFNQAQDKLANLGLTAVELNTALTDLSRQQAAATKLPTYAELAQMFKASIITQDEFAQTLQALGYPQVWADRFVRLNGGT